ncbi:HupE/UreJ family protein [Thalassotalea mangrovi]|uniref:HupE/UreJ family protein n=1 Tax=Thalassotalea mangrovi TaxID=2572245 RepID=A0A4U1B7V4_9GAMM|nr:HupE/UreJ family protein [Thalassotalea mangrovi]TKB46322.1 HupE/UreJ family protein [Thalassotalea mangrovi]
MRAAVCIVMLLLISKAMAHEARPVVVNLTQQAQILKLAVQAPASLPADQLPSITVAASCAEQLPASFEHRHGVFSSEQWLNCTDSIAGQVVNIQYPQDNPSLSTLVKVQLRSGEKFSQLLSPAQLSWQIPVSETVSGITWQYTQLGVEHIWLGWDHLLFVMCLVLVAGTVKRVVITVTGFTLGHSVTLIAASLGVIQVPVALFESLIALSIVFLAVELASRNAHSWLQRFPLIISAGFGLLHGLGFASVLADIGLPQVQVFWGLLAFNLGIELGQLSFVIVVMGLMALGRKLVAMPAVQAKATTAMVYGIGITSSYWFWQRSLNMFLGREL